MKKQKGINLEIENNHNYFVGEESVLVHGALIMNVHIQVWKIIEIYMK